MTPEQIEKIQAEGRPSLPGPLTPEQIEKIQAEGRPSLPRPQPDLDAEDFEDTLPGLEGLDPFKRPIRAARGFDGMVNRPTSFIAGEGGEPEHVKVTPMGQDRGQGMAGAKITLIENLTIQANDAKSVQEWLEGGAEDVFRDLIYRLQLDGVDVTA